MKDFLLLLIVHATLTFFMVGVIWFVQVVHYPLYKRIKEGFSDYEKMHMRRSAFLLGPVMFGEAATALFLAGSSNSALISRLAALNLIFLSMIWIATLLFQVAQHQRLAVRFSPHVHHLLLATNWIRVALWTIRAIILATMLYLA